MSEEQSNLFGDTGGFNSSGEKWRGRQKNDDANKRIVVN